MLQTNDTVLQLSDPCFDISLWDKRKIGFYYIEAISANEIATSVVPMPGKMLPYTIEAGPPLLSENWKVAAAASHETCKTKEKLIAGTRLMYLCEAE
jgi:hypothetical protein